MTYIDLINKAINEVNGKLTPHEMTTYRFMLENGYDEPHFEMKDIEGLNGLSSKQLRGVISSLIKKGLVMYEQDKINFKTVDMYYPIVNGIALSFPCDEYSYQ